MKLKIKYILQVLIAISGLSITVLTLLHMYFEKQVLFLIFITLGTLYHIIIDKSSSTFFLRIAAIYIISSFINCISLFHGGIANIIYTSQILDVAVTIIILKEMYDKTKKDFFIVNYSWQAFLLLAINLFIIYQTVSLVLDFNLGLDHLFYGFIIPLIKIAILSVGIIFYLSSPKQKQKLFFLNNALVCFLLADIFDILNYLYFFTNPIDAISVLQSGFVIIGMLLLYMYSMARIEKH